MRVGATANNRAPRLSARPQLILPNVRQTGSNFRATRRQLCVRNGDTPVFAAASRPHFSAASFAMRGQLCELPRTPRLRCFASNVSTLAVKRSSQTQVACHSLLNCSFVCCVLTQDEEKKKKCGAAQHVSAQMAFCPLAWSWTGGDGGTIQILRIRTTSVFQTKSQRTAACDAARRAWGGGWGERPMPLKIYQFLLGGHRQPPPSPFSVVAPNWAEREGEKERVGGEGFFVKKLNWLGQVAKQ